MAFVVSGGQLRALEPPTSWLGTRPGYSVAMSTHRTMTYAAIYRAQPAVRTVVGFLARNLSQLALRAYRRIEDTDRERLTDHPLAVLLRQPNSRTTQYRFMNSLVSDLGIYDDGYWVKLRNDDGQPISLRRIQPWRVEALGPEWTDAEGYRIHGSRGYLDLDPSEIMHFHGYNPDDSRHGCSPLEALRQVLAEEYAASSWREQMWRNGARVSGYIKRPADAPDWSSGGKARFKADWQAQYTGDGPQAGGTPILEDGMEFTPAAINPKEAQYVESRRLTREEVAAEYYIAPPLVGILEHATFSNIKEQHKQLYQDTLGPWCAQIEQEVDLQLVPELPASDRVYVEFNIAEKLQGSFEEQAQHLQAAVGAPYMTRNEARALNNLPAVEGGDELIVPLNVLEGGLASPQDTAPPPKALTGRRRTKRARAVQVKGRAPAQYDAEGKDVLATFFARQSTVVRTQLGAAKSRGAKAVIGDVWDQPRWDAELAADLLDLALKAARAVAQAVLSALGLDPSAYDEPRTVAFQRAVAERVAHSVNSVTRTRLVEALADEDPAAAVAHVFDVAQSQRAEEIATSHVTASSGFATTEAVRQTERPASKTWVVTSNNPRPTHLVMNGQTVDIDAKFSNGAEWPADAFLPVDEVAGCQCELEVTVEDDDED